MKKRHLFAGILACALTLTLAACGLSGSDVTTYIQGELDCTYKGQYSQEYLDLVDGMTEEDAKQQYEDNAQAEAQRLLNYLEVFYPNDEVNERATQLVKDIYAKAQYSVGDEASTLSEADYQELDAEYALRMIEKVEQVLPQATYGQDQSVMLQLKLDGDYYSLVSSGWTTLDDMVIDYTGDYM